MSKKRVLFLLGTLEKSKCGVADYTHMLADTLHKEGHTCISVAINDRFLYKIQSSSTCQLDDNLFLIIGFLQLSRGDIGFAIGKDHRLL